MGAYLQKSHQTSHQGHSHGCHTFPSLAQVTDRQTDRQKTVSLLVYKMLFKEVFMVSIPISKISSMLHPQHVPHTSGTLAGLTRIQTRL